MIVISSGFQGSEYPLTHGRVCWNWYRDGTVSSAGASGFPQVNALPPRTDTAWRPASLPATWTSTFPDARDISFIGIAKHDLGTQNATINIQYRVGGVTQSFPGAGALTPQDDNPILLLTVPTAADLISITVTAADSEPTISVIMIGLADEWPQPFTWPGRPITEGDQIRFENTIAVNGNWLGRSVASDGLGFELQMDHASEEWRQTKLKAFKAYANGNDAAFFIAPRPNDYPEEVSYAWATNVVTGARSMPNKSVSTSVTLSCQGLRPYV